MRRCILLYAMPLPIKEDLRIFSEQSHYGFSPHAVNCRQAQVSENRPKLQHTFSLNQQDLHADHARRH